MRGDKQQTDDSTHPINPRLLAQVMTTTKTTTGGGEAEKFNDLYYLVFLLWRHLAPLISWHPHFGSFLIAMVAAEPIMIGIAGVLGVVSALGSMSLTGTIRRR